MFGTMAFHGSDHLFYGQSVGKQRVVGVMCVEPLHDFVGLGMQNKFSALQPHHCFGGNTSAVHQLDNVVQS